MAAIRRVSGVLLLSLGLAVGVLSFLAGAGAVAAQGADLVAVPAIVSLKQCQHTSCVTTGDNTYSITGNSLSLNAQSQFYIDLADQQLPVSPGALNVGETQALLIDVNHISGNSYYFYLGGFYKLNSWMTDIRVCVMPNNHQMTQVQNWCTANGYLLRYTNSVAEILAGTPNPYDYLSMYTYGNNAPFNVSVTLHWLQYNEPEPPDPPEPPDYDPALGWCPFTTTITTTQTTITGTAEITQTVTYSRPVNLAQNPGFEAVGAAGPLAWQAAAAGGLLNSIDWWRSDPAAHSGSRYATAAGLDVIQDLPIYSAGTYAAGMFTQCPGGSGCDPVSLIWNGSVVASTTPTATWGTITGTRATGGGSAWFGVRFGGLGPFSSSWVDDVFIYPVDPETGGPLCDPAFYEPYNPEIDGSPPAAVIPTGDGGALPVPIGGAAGVKCYTCPIPSNLLSIGGWIGYLACIIKNLFSCSLRVWLINVINVIAGVWRLLWSLLAWLPAVVQALAAWGLGVFSGFISWWWGWLGSGLAWVWSLVSGGWGMFARFVDLLWAALVDIGRQLVINILESEFVQAVWRLAAWGGAVWDVVIVLVRALVQLVIDVYQGIAAFVEFLIDVAGRVRDAFGADPYEIVIVTEEGQTVNGLPPGDLYASGANPTKILWLFLTAIGALDFMIGDFNLQIVLGAAVGVLAIGLIFWTLRLWHDIIPV